MGRTPDQLAQNKAEAIAFFSDRFGLDFSKSDVVDGVNFRLFLHPPKANYRAYTVSGEEVGRAGWAVRDGGWLALVGPQGARLHGTWGGPSGRQMPQNTILLFGDYSIDRELPDGSHGVPIVIHYKSTEPLQSFETMPLAASDLSSPDFGTGQGVVVYSLRPLPDGRFHEVLRSVLTFP